MSKPVKTNRRNRRVVKGRRMKSRVARKPRGTPPMTEMVTDILRRAMAAKKPGLTPAEVTQRINKRWWKECSNQWVSPIMWRMEKSGQLAKHEGAVYSLSASH